MGYSKDAIRDHLLAAGCGESLAKEFLEAYDGGNMKKAFSILEGKREELLDEYHACGKCIDCMDYLVYRLKKEE